MRSSDVKNVFGRYGIITKTLPCLNTNSFRIFDWPGNFPDKPYRRRLEYHKEKDVSHCLTINLTYYGTSILCGGANHETV